MEELLGWVFVLLIVIWLVTYPLYQAELRRKKTLENMVTFCDQCLQQKENCQDTCPGKIRKVLEENKQLPRPDGYLSWDVFGIIKSANLGEKQNYNVDLLRKLRDGRFGFHLMEYWFDGKEDPLDNNKIVSDGSSEPDARSKENPDHEYEIKGITHKGLSIAASHEQGKGRKVDPDVSHSDRARDYAKWIFVDRLSLTYEKSSSLSYYFVRGTSLARAIEENSKFTDYIKDKKNDGEYRKNQGMLANRSTGDYIRALQLIHAAQQIQNDEQE